MPHGILVPRLKDEFKVPIRPGSLLASPERRAVAQRGRALYHLGLAEGTVHGRPVEYVLPGEKPAKKPMERRKRR